MTDAEQIAAFIARKGITVCETAPAYGVDPMIDRDRREAARSLACEQQYANAAENRAERAAEAFAAGDRDAGTESGR